MIRERLIPKKDKNGLVIWVGKGKKTVDFQGLRERSEALGIAVDWNRLEKVNVFRNEIEHFYSELPTKSIEGLLSDSFVIIRDFLSHQLKRDPRKFLGEKGWNTLLKVSEVFQKEKDECQAIMASIPWKSESMKEIVLTHECESCGSPLIACKDRSVVFSSLVFHCRACNANWDIDDFIERAIHDSDLNVPDSEYVEPSVIECPECNRNAYILSENVCQCCGSVTETECQKCGMEIPAVEIDGSGYCSWCSHMMSKDDDFETDDE